MEINRLEQISKKTGMSLDEVAEAQLDEEPFPEKYITNKVLRKESSKQMMANMKKPLMGAMITLVGICNLPPMLRSISYMKAEFRNNHSITYTESVSNVKRTLDKTPFCHNKVAKLFLEEPGEHLGYLLVKIDKIFD